MSQMATKTKRIEMRADAESEARIARAAALMRESISAFVLGAAGREADRVLRAADHSVMPAAQFDTLIASLDVADAAPQLQRIARRRRVYKRA